MSSIEATTTVTVEMRGRRPTIEDVRLALDVLTAEGVPPTFDVQIIQSEEREWSKDVPVNERPVNFLFRMEASRAAKHPEASA